MVPITVHCIVKNEERWIWYAINSVVDIADQILVYDTGSTDSTVEIIRKIKSKKIIFRQMGEVNATGLVNLRRQQLKVTKTPWFLILDGDEVWPSKTKKELLRKLNGAKKDVLGVVVRAWNFVGDIYHLHPESLYYHWPFAPKDWQGWANLRLISTKVPSLGIKGRYPLEYYHDKTGVPIQNYGEKHLIFLENRYFHTTYLQRSSTRSQDRNILNRTKKWKIELGYKLPEGIKYPEVFNLKKPNIVPSPWVKRSQLETLLAATATPIKELRRRTLGLYKPKSF